MTEIKHKSTRSDPTLTPESRLIYLYLHERRAKDGQGQAIEKPRHECTILVPKLHADPMLCANYQGLANHCMDACAKQPEFGGGFPQGGQWPIKDGDVPQVPAARPGVVPDPNKYAQLNEARRGHWVIEASSVFEPGPRICVMQGGQAVEIPARVIAGKTLYKSGDYGFVSIHAYTYNNKKYGVKFGFEGVLFSREGEAIGGQGGPRAAAAMFGGVATVAPAGTVPVPPNPTQPVAAGAPVGYGPIAPMAAVVPQHAPAPSPAGNAVYPSSYAPQNPTPQPVNPAPPPPPPPPASMPVPVPGQLPPFPAR